MSLGSSLFQTVLSATCDQWLSSWAAQMEDISLPMEKFTRPVLL